jgi:hypothetical protein
MLRAPATSLFGGDHCLSALLSIFEYLTNGAMDALEEAGESGDPWVMVKTTELVATMDALFSERSTYDRLEKLVASGLLQRRKGGRGEVNSYLLDYHRVNRLIESGAVLGCNFAVEGKSGVDCNFAVEKPISDCNSAAGSTAILQSYKEIEKDLEKTVQNNTVESVSNPEENATPTRGAEREVQTQTPCRDDEDINLDTAIAEVTGIYRCAKGLKRPKWNTKHGAANAEKLASLVKDLGYSTVIGAVRAYVEDFKPDLPSLKDKPLDWILTNARILSFASPRGLPNAGARKAAETPATEKPYTGAPAPPMAVRELKTLLQGTEPVPGFREPDVFGFWNATMPEECRASVMTTVLRQGIEAHSSDADFARQWMDLVGLAAKMVASGKLKFKPTLGWFLRDGWAKIANHEFDWALSELATGQSDSKGFDERDLLASVTGKLFRAHDKNSPGRFDKANLIMRARQCLDATRIRYGMEKALQDLRQWVDENFTPEERAAWIALLWENERAALRL